jgi:hypothetical protein
VNTTRNRAKVLAQFLRAAMRDVHAALAYVPSELRDELRNSAESIDAVAEELERGADGVISCTAGGRKGKCRTPATAEYQQSTVRGAKPYWLARCDAHPLKGKPSRPITRDPNGR